MGPNATNKISNVYGVRYNIRMNINDLYWLAGWLEGEGSFTRGRNGRGTRTYPRITGESTDLEVLEMVQEIAGGHITGPRTRNRANHQPTWVWAQTKSTQAKSLMHDLRPLMSERRQGQIDRALSQDVHAPKPADA